VRRREFITLLGGAATWPIAAQAQQPAMPVVGVLSSAGSLSSNSLATFRRSLSEAGYVEGRNVSIEYRSADGQNDRLPAMAAELVQQRVAVIVAAGAATVPVAKAATATIPIIFVTGVDPVAMGLVSSLNRPGGNLTGITSLGTELGAKKLELLREVVPTATSIAALINPSVPDAEVQTRDLQAAARTLGLQLHVLHASTERDFDAAFAVMAQSRSRALMIGVDAFFIGKREKLAALTVRDALPAIFSTGSSPQPVA
jgi:putative ABC transport system substrate-binding protein